MGAQYEIVDTDKEFVFKGLCPYCGGDLTYRALGFKQEDDGLWAADGMESLCSTMPDFQTQKKLWHSWISLHSHMPYVYQLPVDVMVEEQINSKYRFNVEES